MICIFRELLGVAGLGGGGNLTRDGGTVSPSGHSWGLDTSMADHCPPGPSSDPRSWLRDQLAHATLGLENSVAPLPRAATPTRIQLVS